MGSRWVKITAAVAGVAAVGAAAYWAGTGTVDSPKPKPEPGRRSRLVEFRHEKGGWAISHPADWNRLPPKDPDVSLVVAEQPVEQNRGGSILARDVTLGAPVGDGNLAAAREVTDRIVNGDGIQHLTEPAVVRQGGLPGYVYFYSFKDAASGLEGVHSHYFLFKGATMISFVFQALPKDDFQRLAALYDEVIASFRVL